MEADIVYAKLKQKLKQNLHLNPTEAKLKTQGKYIYLSLTGLALANVAALIALFFRLPFHPSLLLILLTVICAQFINRHGATALYQASRNRAKVLLAGSALALVASSCNVISMWMDINAQSALQMHSPRAMSFSAFIFASSLVILPCINLSLKSFSVLIHNQLETLGNSATHIGQQLFITLHLFILVPGTAVLLFLQPPQNSFAAFNLIGFCLLAFILLVIYRQRLWYQPLMSKTQIFVPWAIYFFPYCFLLTQYAGHFWNFYLPISISQPTATAVGVTQTIEINLVWLIVIDLLTALVLVRGLNFRWRKNLGDVDLDKKHQANTADHQHYIDHQNYAATINNYVRLTPNSAVIGITGVRGAGKSALMNEVSQLLNKDYKVIRTVAPNETQDMAFLVSICRNLCQSVIRKTRYLLFDDQNPEQQSRIQSSRKLSLLLGLALTLGISMLLYLKQKEDNHFSLGRQQQAADMLAIEQDLPYFTYQKSPMGAASASDESAPDESAQVDSEQVEDSENSEIESEIDDLHFIDFDQNNLSAKFSFIVKQEQDITANLLRQVKQFKPQDKWAAGQKIQLNFGTPGLGYSLNILQSTRVYQDNHPKTLSYEQMEQALYDTATLDITDIDLNYDFHDYYFHDNALHDDHSDIPLTEPALWPYIHFVLTGEPYLELSPSNSFSYADNINILDLIANHVLVSNYESKLLQLDEFAQISQDFRALFGLQNYVKDYQQKPAHHLLTWVLAETLTTNKRAIVFNQAQLQRFELVLNQYQSLLKHGKSQTIEQANSKRMTFKYWYDQLRAASPLKQYPHLEFFIAFLIFMLWLGPFLWRYLDQLFRALANPAASALLRASEQFMDTLSYKSDFGQSAGLANSWFSFSRSVNKQERELNLPALTNLFANYAKILTSQYQGKLIIVIDELDKIHDIQQVEGLLSEIKGALATPNCYFLIALGEDCAQSFRQRQSAGQDIFESSFDEIFHVTEINAQSVEHMVSNLVIEENDQKRPTMDPISYTIIYLYCAGLAREIMRTLKLIYSDKSIATDLTAANIANYLLKREWQNWHFELEELPIDGQTMANLFELTDQSGESCAADALRQDLVDIDKAIDTLDNNNKRQTLLWNNDDSDNPQLMQFKARIGATRSLIKLKLMTLLNLWLQNGQLAQLSKQQHKTIVECFNQLEQQPYLAETLIAQLMAKITISAKN